MGKSYRGNAVVTTLTADISSGDLTLLMAANTGWPSGAGGQPFVAQLTSEDGLAREKVLVAARSGLILTVTTRGYDGTTAAAFSTGATIEHVFDAQSAQDFADHADEAAPHSGHLTTTTHDLAARHSFGAALGTPGTPANVGTATSAGSAAEPARANHVHVLDPTIAGAGLVLSSGVLAVSVDGTSVEVSGDTLQVKPTGIGPSQLADGAVTLNKVGANAIGAGKLADGAVDTTARLADGVVSQAKLVAAVPRGELAYVERTTSQTGISTTYVDLASLAVTFTPASATRKVLLSFCIQVRGTGIDVNTFVDLAIREGSTVLRAFRYDCRVDGQQIQATGEHRLIPSSGAHTYKLSMKRNSGGAGTVELLGGGESLASFRAEDLGGS